MKISVYSLQKKYRQIKDCLDEKGRRIWCANEALAIGRNGVGMVHAATEVSRPTIYKGIRELKRKIRRKKRGRPRKKSNTGVRKKGGGAKSISKRNPAICAALVALVEPATKGDPESPLQWTNKGLRKLANELTKQGFDVSHSTVAMLLKEAGYSLQLNRKEKEGKSVPDRNAQFEHINEKAKTFLQRGDPVISVDAKKKELIGNFKNSGREYRQKGDPVEVNVHDFPEEDGKVAPYGIYDIGKNKGWVSVGVASDTAEFAVNTIRSWWRKMGKKEYSHAKNLMITADCGGSNGYRTKLWKWELQKLANELDLTIHVCHFPPGTSKWNKIEHKMFSYITQNWRGVPLITKEVVVKLIGSTKTNKGLEIQAQIDNRIYTPGKEVDEEDFKKILLVADEFHGEWNYTISPQIKINISL